MTKYPTAWKRYDDSVGWQVAPFCEMAAFRMIGDDWSMVGKIVPYKTYDSTAVRTLERFGFTVKWRQVKEYKEPAKKKKDESTTERVTTESYDIDGNLLERTIEGRMVWHNSKGSYIKTRGAGRVFISDPETMTIRYEQIRRGVNVWSSQYQRHVIQEKIVKVLVPPKA